MNLSFLSTTLKLQSLNQDVKLALLQILEGRYVKRAVIITSQLPVGKWHEYINQDTIADLVMDRLTARAHRIELKRRIPHC